MHRNSLTAFALACVLISGCSTPEPDRAAYVRMNQIQVVGTHNSYHQFPNASLLKLIAKSNPDAVNSLSYGHPPLPQQLDGGVRQVELDCYADPTGGRFAHPAGPQAALDAGLPAVPPNDPHHELLKPGIKVMHIPDIDYTSSVLTLIDGLKQVRAWSLAHPRHAPIFLLIELKTESLRSLGTNYTQTLPWDSAQLAELDREILSVFPRDEIITPDSVRGPFATLPEALSQRGWPLLDVARGKVLFGMDNEGAERETYLRGHPVLENRVLFVSVPPENPAAAWMKINNPINDFARIQEMVKEGFLVRTRADEPTGQARANDTTMRDKALASGAQYVSTDYPESDPALSPYCVRLENRNAAQTNPVNGRPSLKGRDLDY